jgi:hypothetical protein
MSPLAVLLGVLLFKIKLDTLEPIDLKLVICVGFVFYCVKYNILFK